MVKRLCFFHGVFALFLLLFYVVYYQGHRAGEKFLKDLDFPLAKEQLREFLEVHPSLFSARLNLAFTLFLLDELDESLREYEKVFEKSKNRLRRFYAYFNSAVIETKRKNKDQALSFYQQALEEEPQSMEVKTNIELLMKEALSQKSPPSQSQKQKKDPSPDQDPSKKQGAGRLDPKQVESILKELEKREQELKFKLNEKKSKRRRGPQW